MAIEIVYFDLGNVLVSFSHDQGIQQIAALANCSPDAVESALVSSGLNNQYESGEVDTEEFCARFCEAVGTQVDVHDLAHAWSSIFTLRPQAIGLAARLTAAGHRIGVLSNTSPAHWEFVSLRYPLLRTLFCPIVTSYAAGVMKPAAEIYQIAQQAAEVPPARIYFTDDRQENVAAARAAGWQSDLFTGTLALAKSLEDRGIAFNR